MSPSELIWLSITQLYSSCSVLIGKFAYKPFIESRALSIDEIFCNFKEPAMWWYWASWWGIYRSEAGEHGPTGWVLALSRPVRHMGRQSITQDKCSVGCKQEVRGGHHDSVQRSPLIVEWLSKQGYLEKWREVPSSPQEWCSQNRDKQAFKNPFSDILCILKLAFYQTDFRRNPDWW